MKSLPNIEKSGFLRGAYVGYFTPNGCNQFDRGVARITNHSRSGAWWVAVDFGSARIVGAAGTLAELSAKLEAIGKEKANT